MTRRFTASLAITGVVLLIALDQLYTPLNPYQAPPLFALGSGQIAAGGFCGALPN
ncbi:MAG: hypothetical protein JXR35_13615 [Rhodobacteraceae bacterium]|jgi:hypothetical protein|nr:hypothetical protein [Paracoccaceae bacterium]